jgi:predicted GIY-YIG superfamily endonuclease
MPEGPKRTALYRLFDARGALLYVGVTGDPTRRFRDHRTKKDWWQEVARHSVEWFESEWRALQAEVQAIATEAPRHNIRSTEEWKARQSAAAKAVSPENRRRRGVGRAARAVQERTFWALRAQGVPHGEAARQALLVRQQYKEASGLFDKST